MARSARARDVGAGRAWVSLDSHARGGHRRLTPGSVLRYCAVGEMYAPSSSPPDGGGDAALATSSSLSEGASMSSESSHFTGNWATSSGFVLVPARASASASARSRSAIRVLIDLTCAASLSARAMRTLGARTVSGLVGTGENGATTQLVAFCGGQDACGAGQRIRR